MNLPLSNHTTKILRPWAHFAVKYGAASSVFQAAPALFLTGLLPRLANHAAASTKQRQVSLPKKAHEFN